MVPISEVPRHAKTVRASWIEDAEGDSVRSRFAAAEDVNVGSAEMKPVRLLLSLAATRGWKISKYDGVVQYTDTPIDELLALLPPRGMLPEGSAFIAQKALYGASRASSLWREQYARLVKSAG